MIVQSAQVRLFTKNLLFAIAKLTDASSVLVLSEANWWNCSLGGCEPFAIFAAFCSGRGDDFLQGNSTAIERWALPKGGYR
jgi:hypothetical protein